MRFIVYLLAMMLCSGCASTTTPYYTPTMFDTRIANAPNGPTSPVGVNFSGQGRPVIVSSNPGIKG